MSSLCHEESFKNNSHQLVGDILKFSNKLHVAEPSLLNEKQIKGGKKNRKRLKNTNTFPKGILKKGQSCKY